MAALIAILLAFGYQDPSPLLNYHEMEALKEKLALSVVEIEVVPAVAEGVDPNFRPVLTGQGVFVRAPRGEVKLLTSAFLVERAGAIRFRTRKHPNWVDARVVNEHNAGFVVLEPVPLAIDTPCQQDFISRVGGTDGRPLPGCESDHSPSAKSAASIPGTSHVALEAPSENLAVRHGQDPDCQHPRLVQPGVDPSLAAPLASHSTLRHGALVFSIDNPVGALTNIFWGYLNGFAEPPLSEHLLTSTGLALGCPLFSAEGALVALNVRRYTVSSNVYLAVSASQIARGLTGIRREPAANERRSRRSSSTQPGQRTPALPTNGNSRR